MLLCSAEANGFPKYSGLTCFHDLPRQIKGLSSWATAQDQRSDGDAILERHHPSLITTLVRCMRLSFVGSAPIADGDAQYAEIAGTGEVLYAASSIKLLRRF